MRYRELTVLTGVIAALALAQGPAHALDLLGNKIGGNANINLGSGNTSGNVNVGAGNTTGTANIGTGGTSTAKANASVSSGSGGALPNSLSAKANINLRDSVKGGRATVDINGDGVIDDKDTAMVKLDVNGDGTLNILDDVNGDGRLTQADLDISLCIGGGCGPTGGKVDVDADDDSVVGVVDLDIGGIGIPPIDNIGVDIDILPGPGPRPRPDPDPGPGPGPGIDPRDFTDTFRNLNDSDVAALKIKCRNVLANPSGFSAATLRVCRVLASL